LGDALIRLLEEQPHWANLTVAVAFVKFSGVKHLIRPLRALVAHATIIRFIVGVDHRGSSREGLQSLLEAVTPTGDVWVFHNENPSTYHPKVFLFEKLGRAALVLGSGNLSEGGLYTNYEMGLLIDLDTEQPQDAALLEQIRQNLDALLADQRVAVHLDNALLEQLATLRMIVTEGEARDDEEERERRGPPAPPKGTPFRRVVVQRAPRANGQPLRRPRRQQARPAVAPVPQRALIWQKQNLQRADAQLPSGRATNPTGNLRLSRANWRVGGQLIDHKTYFRHVVFGNSQWRLVQQAPRKEETTIPFQVTTLGQNLGMQNLTVSHQASRVANQGNVATILHWGLLTQTIRNANIVGRTLNLYVVQANEQESFELEVV
jgi:HKD family nuclease